MARKLYPPITEGTIPAFYGDSITIPYSMNRMVNKNEIAGFSLKIKTVQSNLFLGTIIGCNKRMMYGPICGVVVSILMILNFNLIDIILGILYLVECISLIKYMKD